MNHKVWAKNYELWATRYKLQATRYELATTRYEIRVKIWDKSSRLRQLLTLRYFPLRGHSRPRWSAPANVWSVQVLHYSINSSTGVNKISNFIVQSPFAGFCEFNRQQLLRRWNLFFTSLTVVSLLNEKKHWRQDSLSVRIVWAWFWPLLNLAGQYL